MNRELGRDLNWFWYYWLFTTDSVNGSIKDVVSNGGKTKVTVHQAGEMPSPVVLKVEFADGRVAATADADRPAAMPPAKPVAGEPKASAPRRVVKPVGQGSLF